MLVMTNFISVVSSIIIFLNKKIILIVNITIILLLVWLYNYLTITNKLLADQKNQILAGAQEINKENIQVVIDFLTAMAQKKSKNLWLDKASFNGQTCELSLEFKSKTELTDFYQYFFAMIYAKPSFKILSLTLKKAGYDISNDSLSENKEAEQVQEVKIVPYEIAVLLEQKARQMVQQNPQDSISNEKNDDRNDNKLLQYNYQYDVKLSVCN